MQSRYQFREITKSGVPQMFSMILKRMEWMDEKGIQQWNAAKYDTIYPLSYYEEKRGRRMERLRRMTNAGRAVLPDMSEKGFVVDKDILNALQTDAEVWESFKVFRHFISV